MSFCPKCGFTFAKGKPRSLPQNRLQRMWVNEAAAQLGDDDAEGYRAYCKLHFGVPILRNQSDEFREAYDRVIRPLPYESKIAMMKVPLDFPVTRLMSSFQKKQYLDAMREYLEGRGVVLSIPDDYERAA